MKQRTFRAKNMAEAVEQVKKTLGKDAIIVSVRQVLLDPAWMIWQTPGVEVLAVRRGEAREEALLEQLQATTTKKQKTAAEQPIIPDGEPPPKKLTPKSDSRSLNLQAFQAALRRANTEKENEKVGEENILPPEKETDLETEVLLSTAASIESTTPTPEPQKETTYEGLNLNPPKPKLAIQELTEALLGSQKPAPLKPLEELAENLRKIEQKQPSDIEARAEPTKEISTQMENKDQARVTPTTYTHPVTAAPLKGQLRHRPSADVHEELLTKVKEHPKKLIEAQTILLNQGVERTVVEKMVKICAESLSPQSLARDNILQDYLKKQLESNIHVFSPSALATHHQIVIIGSSGVGKTSLSGKLAAHITQERRQNIVWISADTVRTGAIAEAKVFTELLDIPLYLIYTPEDLRQVVENIPHDTVMLIDTPACNPYREDNLVELGKLLETLPQRTTYMALPATMKEMDITQTLAAYTLFKVDGFVITKMDETCEYGAVYNVVWRSKLPVAYFTYGVRLLDDLVIAEANVLSTALFGESVHRG